ncbi:methyltransferase type 11 domain containing protein [Nitzschia inconspicua]|uniref:Methyltransferase type 11 domain containing protein n=1 Tax=Nitzschia inconspicua TaxID=303405 RepID=A0A9K3KR90_9STRA|nr:methyltransferase type 11 domain containing protein [Nitzschia inconspicua]
MLRKYNIYGTMYKNNSLFALVLLVAPIAAFRAPENPMVVKQPVVVKDSSRTLITTVPNIVDDATLTTTISQQKLADVGKTIASQRFVKPRHATERKVWGVDNEVDDHGEYWFDSRIHTFGNVGFLGALHAAMAPLSTKVIDVVAYDGKDVRSMVAKKLAESARCSKAKILDMCCGVGISTRALREAFPEAEVVVGVDTSPEMITMAKFLNSHLGFFKPIAQVFAHLKKIRFSREERLVQHICGPVFSEENAEQTQFPGQSFQFVTLYYALHEVPKGGRDRILREAYRVLQPGGTLAIVDICTDYTPSDSMLAGEPYVLEYQKNIHRQLRSMKGFSKVQYETIVPKHVGMWTLKRSTLEL